MGEAQGHGGHVGQSSIGWDGLPRFPCAPDKSPLTRNGFKNARPGKPNAKWPLAGIATGAVSGIDCLDIDPAGVPWFNEVPLPATRHQLTRRCGLHLFFRHVDGLRCSSGRVAQGVDIRADGGYIIDWHREGLDTLWPEKLAPWPEWVLAHLRGKSPPSMGEAAHMSAQSPTNPKGEHYHSMTRNFRARVRWNLNRLQRQQPGGRTHMLFEVACQFAEMITEKRIRPAVAMDLMLGACRLNGLIRDYSKEKALRTIADAFRIIEQREL